jgi:phospholipase C
VRTPRPRHGTDRRSNTGRCGLGPRLPFLVLSPAVKANTVDHSLMETTSILRMIEDRFTGGQRIGGVSFDVRAAGILNPVYFKRPGSNEPLILDPSTGEPIGGDARAR